MCEAYCREKAGLSSGGSGLKYPMWNVERSSLSTDKAKNVQWRVTLVGLNMLWAVQELDLEGIRIDSAAVLETLKLAVVSKCKQQQDHPCYHWRVPGRAVPVSQLHSVLHSASHTSQAGLASLQSETEFLEHGLLLYTSEKEPCSDLTSALKSCLAKDSFCPLCHGEEKFLGVPPSSQLLPAAGAVQLAYPGADGFLGFFLSQPSNL